MGTHILTLFGEEIVPEQLNAVGRKKSAPKPKKEKAEKKEVEEVVAEVAEEVIAALEPVAKKAVKKAEVVEATPVEDKFTDWEGEKKYYSIGEVAKIFNVRTSNILCILRARYLCLSSPCPAHKELAAVQDSRQHPALYIV